MKIIEKISSEQLIKSYHLAESHAPLKIRSFKGHQILTPALSQEELAQEMFQRQ